MIKTYAQVLCQKFRNLHFDSNKLVGFYYFVFRYVQEKSPRGFSLVYHNLIWLKKKNFRILDRV